MAAHPTFIRRLAGRALLTALALACGCGGPLPPPDPPHLAAAKDSLSQGNHWFGRGCYAEAESFFAESLASARLGDQMLLMIRAQNSLGAAALARGDLETAAARLERALELSRSQPNEPELDKILANLGSLAFKLGRLDDAATLWTEALAAAQARGQSPAPQLCNLARLRLAQGRQEEFLDLTAQALAATASGPVPASGVTRLASGKDQSTARSEFAADISPAVRADALNLAGQAALLEDRPAEAEAFFLQALKLDRQIESVPGLAQDTEALGRLMLQLERPREAAGYLDRAFFLHLAAGDDSQAEETLAALQTLSRERGFPRDLSPHREALRRPESYRLTSQCP